MVSQHLRLAAAYSLIDKAEIKTNKSNVLAWTKVIDKYKESKLIAEKLRKNLGEISKN
tara:strand:- start:851 stop:1024 length:174 start_codon:yes stop_codon:yes gene_type:complete